MLNDFVVKPEVASEARYNLVTRRPNVKLPGVPYRAFRPRRVSVLFGYGPVHTVGMRNANPNRNRHSDPFLSRGSLPLPKVEAKDKRSDFDRHEARHVSPRNAKGEYGADTIRGEPKRLFVIKHFLPLPLRRGR